MLEQTIRDGNISIALVSEPNKKMVKATKWIVDQNGDTAIKINDQTIKIQEVIEGDRFSGAKLEDDTLILSCYVSPNADENDFLSYLDDLKMAIRKRRPHKLLIAGDFNAKSPRWGSDVEDRRGILLGEWMDEGDLEVANSGTTPTFERRQQRSHIDVTMHNLHIRIENWRVTDEENLSDHNSIRYEVDSNQPTREIRTRAKGWLVPRNPDMSIYQQKLHQSIALNNRGKTAEEMQENIIRACNKSFRKRRNETNCRQAVYWWTEELAQARRECIRARRITKRVNRRRDISDEIKELRLSEYKTLRDALTNKIEKAKRNAWDRLIQDLDEDIWGSAYKIARKKLRIPNSPSKTDEEQMREAGSLFPTNAKINWILPSVRNLHPALLTLEDIKTAVKDLRTGRAPGPDCIPAIVVKATIIHEENYILEVFNNIWTKCMFPKIWKKGKLVLIEKPKKEKNAKQTYRPICLLNEMGKLYERLINKKLQEDIEKKGGLSDLQFGFRKGKSTVDALSQVMEISRAANSGIYKNRDFCMLITVDVKNAFNSAPWKHIIAAMRKRNLDPHLIAVVKAYLSERTLQVGETGLLDVTCGVPQGSVLGPTLWNLFYDGVLRLDVPKGEVSLIGYADDLAVVITARTAERMEELANKTMEKITHWMVKNKLKIAPEKTEAVILVGRRTLKELSFTVGKNRIQTREKTRYLGVILNRNMSMTEHIKFLRDKTIEAGRQINMLMPNTAGPRSSKRKLLVTVIHSIVLYAAPIWAEALKYQRYKMMVQRIQRSVLIRAGRAYRTTSNEALCVVTGIPPIHLLVEERVGVYSGVSPEVQHAMTENKWQQEWDNNETKGQWTKTLITSITNWRNRKHGELTYHLTQVLTGHGCFRAYLYKIRRADSEDCPYCGLRDDVKHTIFECPRWAEQRCRIARCVEEDVEDGNLVRNMLESEEKWATITENLREIISTKETEEKVIYL